jgi:Tol biopolymer transport system component
LPVFISPISLFSCRISKIHYPLIAVFILRRHAWQELIRMIKRTVASLASLVLLSACTADALPNPLRPQAGAGSVQVTTELEPTRTPALPSTPVPTPQPTRAPATTPSTNNNDSRKTRTTQYESCSTVKPALAAIPPALPDSTGQIVYVTAEGNIALTDITGRSRINVTSDAYVSEDRQAGMVYQFPTFSSDSRSIAFVSLSTTADFQGVTQTVHVAPADGNAVTPVYATSEWGIPYLDFSPDGRQVAFLTINPRGAAVRVVSSAGGEAGIVESGSPMYWHWRSDSAALLTHFNGRAEQPGDASITVVNVNGATQAGRQVLDALPGAFQSPHFSPDGLHMLYVANAGGKDELVLAGADGKPICAVMPIDTNAYFAWSPDGSKAAVMDTQSPVQLPAQVRVHDFSSGESKTVQEEASAFFWSPEGNRIATYRLVSNASQTSISHAGGRMNAPATQSQRVALRIEVVDVDSGSSIRVADTLPTQQFGQYLQYFDQYSRAVSPWSPDGRHIVFTSMLPDNNTADITVASFGSTQTGPSLKRVAAGVVAFWSPR